MYLLELSSAQIKPAYRLSKMICNSIIQNVIVISLGPDPFN